MQVISLAYTSLRQNGPNEQPRQYSVVVENGRGDEGSVRPNPETSIASILRVRPAIGTFLALGYRAS